MTQIDPHTIIYVGNKTFYGQLREKKGECLICGLPLDQGHLFEKMYGGKWASN